MSAFTMLWASLLMLLLILTLISYRLYIVIGPTRRHRPNNGRNVSTHLLIVLGSGGHTAEMISTLQRAITEKDHPLKMRIEDFTHRTWIVSSGDSLSAQRAKMIEDSLSSSGKNAGKFSIQVVPRAREIHQPLITAPLSSLRCLSACFRILLHDRTDAGSTKDFPDIILCNGPATATILILASLLLRFFNVRRCNSRGKMRTIYFESFARVKKLSLSGKLLKPVVDRFLVQWQQLEEQDARAEYWGVLV